MDNEIMIKKKQILIELVDVLNSPETIKKNEENYKRCSTLTVEDWYQPYTG